MFAGVITACGVSACETQQSSSQQRLDPVVPTASGHSASSHPASSHSASPAPGASASPRTSLSVQSLSLADLQAASLNEWLRCHQGFTTSGDLTRDLLRLGVLCGPSTGMQASGPRFSGTLSAQASTSVRIDFDRECMRIVAVAGGSVEDLEVELLTKRDESLALVNMDKPWAVLPADKPLCTPHEATYVVRLVTHAGEGPFALRVLRYWPTGKAPGGTTLSSGP